MNSKQKANLRYQLERARDVVENYPEVGDMFKAGKTYPQIGKYLKEVGIEGNSLDQVAGRAIRGYDGGLGIEPFVGLIPDKGERQKIAKEHIIAANREAYKNGIGIHGMSSEDRVKSGSGMHAKNKEERSRLAKEMVRVRGDIPWDGEISPNTLMSEEEFMIRLTMNEEFKIQSGSNTGKVSWSDVIRAIDGEYHHNRSINAAKLIWQRKKQKYLGNSS